MSEQISDFYEFGRFRLKSDERVLLRGEEFVPLTPKAFDILLTLLENDGRIVRKDDLMKKVWPDTFVEEGNLTQNVSLLRKALGESATGPQFIETVPRRGYRFVAPVHRGDGNGRENSVEAAIPGEHSDHDKLHESRVAPLATVNEPSVLPASASSLARWSVFPARVPAAVMILAAVPNISTTKSPKAWLTVSPNCLSCA
jgi:DNA-binding winged helix-turn-helix (wHTH) protein